MKEVNSYGWKAVIGSSIGYAMDGFDLLILGFMLTLISGDLGLTTGQAGRSRGGWSHRSHCCAGPFP